MVLTGSLLRQMGADRIEFQNIRMLSFEEQTLADIDALIQGFLAENPYCVYVETVMDSVAGTIQKYESVNFSDSVYADLVAQYDAFLAANDFITIISVVMVRWSAEWNLLVTLYRLSGNSPKVFSGFLVFAFNLPSRAVKLKD